jgi:hypothetical protein
MLTAAADPAQARQRRRGCFIGRGRNAFAFKTVEGAFLFRRVATIFISWRAVKRELDADPVE